MNVDGASPAFFVANAAWDLAPMPGESTVSSVWRFAWRNHLSPKELKSVGNPALIAKLSGWDSVSWEAQFFRTLHTKHRSAWWESRFRYCPLCLEHLYHSFWHQSLFLSHCPLDGAWLRTDCYRCGKPPFPCDVDRSVFSKPYTCSTCRGPISGIAASLDLRLAIQERALEFESVFAPVERWWALMGPAREELEKLLPGRSVADYAPWLQPSTSVRQWVLATTPVPRGISTANRTVPDLIILRWKVRLEPDSPTKMWITRTSSQVRFALALQAYRSTIRRLYNAIARRFVVDEIEYRRHQILPPEDLARLPEKVNLHLLALITLRRSYETYFSSLMASPEKAVFEERLVGFPSGNDFAMRIRICWRAQFIAEYASIFWWLMAVRNGRCKMRDLRKENLTLHSADTVLDLEQGDLVSGSVAFPAVDGLDLGLFP